jgi:hypothetical protein
MSIYVRLRLPGLKCQIKRQNFWEKICQHVCQIDSNRIPDKMLDILMSKYMSELMSNSVKQNVGIYVR